VVISLGGTWKYVYKDCFSYGGAKVQDSFDFLLNTIPVKHDMNPYINLLKPGSTMVLVGTFSDWEPLNGMLFQE